MKMEFILKNSKFLKNDYNYMFTEQDLIDITHYAKQENQSIDSVKYCFAIMKYYEHQLILPIVIDSLQILFQNSFRNPFGAQGIIIIGYIINILLLTTKKCLN
jgi:hypothetical protein